MIKGNWEIKKFVLNKGTVMAESGQVTLGSSGDATGKTSDTSPRMLPTLDPESGRCLLPGSKGTGKSASILLKS